MTELTSALEAAHRLREAWRDVLDAPPLRIAFAGVCECRKLTFADWRGQVRHPASFTITCASDAVALGCMDTNSSAATWII